MKRKVLGLDINEEYIAATVVEQSGQDKVVMGSGFARIDNKDMLAEMLPPLLEKVGWQEGTCVCGISLSGISLRNLVIPFTDKKKIAQILPMELEDQLLSSVDEQVVEYILAEVDEDRSHLLVTGLEKDRLRKELELLNLAGLNPDIITLRTVVLVEQFLQLNRTEEGFLIIDTGLHDVNMVIARNGRIVFARRLVYPDRVFTARPFLFGSNGTEIIDHEEAMECVSSLCNDIKRTMGLYQLESKVDTFPENIVLFGAMVGVDEFKDRVESEFGQPVLMGELPKQSGVTWSSDVKREWGPGVFDHAIALAIQGLGKKISINFRKDEFAPQQLFSASKTYLIAASVLFVLILGGVFGYQGYDYKILNTRYTELGGQMKDVFKDTFPEATRIVDPLVQMKTKVKNVQTPSIATPIFSGDKRALNILADISGRVPGNIQIHVSRLVIDKESVTIKGTTDTFNNVNLIQGVLRKSPAYNDVDIVSASAEKDNDLIRFELKLRTTGAS